MRLQIRLLVPDPAPADAGSSVRVSIVDTTMADALHESVAAKVIPLLRAAPEILLEMEVPEGMVRDGRHYSLQAHVDTGSSGEIKTGDLIITHNVPVLTERAPVQEPITARLTRI